LKEKENEKMATELKSNRVLNYTGDPDHWEGWSEKTLARGKRKGYKALLTGKVKIPTASEYELALLGSSAEDQKIKGADTACECEKQKRDMIAKSEER